MADDLRQNRERFSETSTEKEGAKEESSRELGEKRREFIEGVSEVVEGTEAAEMSEGEVSEKTGEGKRKAGGGGLPQAARDTEQKYILPELDVMVIQISTRIKKELAALEKERKNVMRNPSKFSAFRLNEIIMKIRELREILSELAGATAENIKQLWNRFVKGIKP